MDNLTFEQVVARLRAVDRDNDPARVLARIATHLGAWSEWDSGFIEEVAREVNEALYAADLPLCSDQDDSAHMFWGVQARQIGWESDAPGAWVATVNVPGYLPVSDDDVTRLDTVEEAWEYLAQVRRDAEDDARQDTDPEGYSAVVAQLTARSESSIDPAFGEVDPTTGAGTIVGPTPGYTGEHDLGLAYSVTFNASGETAEQARIAEDLRIIRKYDGP